MVESDSVPLKLTRKPTHLIVCENLKDAHSTAMGTEHSSHTNTERDNPLLTSDSVPLKLTSKTHKSQYWPGAFIRARAGWVMSPFKRPDAGDRDRNIISMLICASWKSRNPPNIWCLNSHSLSTAGVLSRGFPVWSDIGRRIVKSRAGFAPHIICCHWFLARFAYSCFFSLWCLRIPWVERGVSIFP